MKFATQPRQKIITAIVFTIGFVGIATALIAYPSINVIKTLSDQIFKQRVELEELYERGQVLKQTLKEYEEIKPIIPTLNQIYLMKGNELEFITTVEKAAADSGVTHDLKLATTDPKKNTNQLQYQLQVNGDLIKFIRYLAELESLNFYVNINTIRLSSPAGSGIQSNQIGTDSALQAILLATSFFKP